MDELDRELQLDITGDINVPVSIDPRRRGIRQYAVVFGYEIGVMDQLDATMAILGIPGARVVKMNSYAAAHRRFRYELGKGNSVGIIGLDSAETREVYIEAIRSALTRSSTPPVESPSHLYSPGPSPSPRVNIKPDPSLSQVHRPTPPSSPSLRGAPVGADLDLGNLSLASPSPVNLLPWSETMRRKPRFAPVGWNPPNGYTPPASAGTRYRPPANLNTVDASTDPKSTHAWYIAYKSREPGIYKTWRDAANASQGFRPLTHGFPTYVEALSRWVDLRERGDLTVVTLAV